MPKSIRPERVNHMNLVVPDFDATVEHFHRLYGAEFVSDLPSPVWHAGLFEFGRALIEIFVPHDFLLNSRYGPHFVGLEYQADMDVVREAIAARGIRIVRDIGHALHTHPADGFGVSFEFYAGYFDDREWPLTGRRTKPLEYWLNEHPLGMSGLKGYTMAVADLPAARAFMQDFLSAEILSESARPAQGAQAVSLGVGNSLVELLSPVKDGPLQSHLHRYGDGIRSMVMAVRDLEKARQYFTERGVPLIPGAAPDSFGLDPAANLGVLIEFSQ
jgi:hypothetical protein